MSFADQYPDTQFIVFADYGNSLTDTSPAMTDPTTDWEKACDLFGEELDDEHEAEVWAVSFTFSAMRNVTQQAYDTINKRLRARGLEAVG